MKGRMGKALRLKSASARVVRSARLRRPGLERLDDRVLLSGVPPLVTHAYPPTTSSVGVRSHFGASFNDYGGPDRVVIDWGDGTSSSGLVSSVSYLP
ncbi:MAG TPA: hypothetical protein VGH33_13460, partial [Isosphaeraceae bacterium]